MSKSDGVWAADQRKMEDVHGTIYITAEAVRAAAAKPPPGTIWIPLLSTEERLGKLIDMQLADLKRDLLRECLAQYALERGVEEAT